MKMAVVGLGAVGGLLAARLAQAGQEVTALSRGAALAAVRAHGLRLLMNGQEQRVALPCSGSAQAMGPQDLVVLAVKPAALAAVAEAIQPLLHDQTTVLPVLNGVPWWFLQAPPVSARLSVAEQRLSSLDPDGRISAALPHNQVLAAVVQFSCSSPEPGLVVHGGGHRLLVGEPDGIPTPRVQTLCNALTGAGFDAEASTDIRSAIWHKLWGQVALNPVSALTGAHSADILDDPLVSQFILCAMAEAASIGTAAGCMPAQSEQQRLTAMRQHGAVQSSMLQDVQAGRPLELDPLIGATHEIGRRFGVTMPALAALLGLTRLMARQRGLYRH